MSLVQNDLLPTEFFTRPTSSTARDTTRLFSPQPSSFALLYPLQTSKKHISQIHSTTWLSARNSRTPTSRCRAGQMRTGTCANQLRRVGVFATLTNAYAIVAVGASENFYRYAQNPKPHTALWWLKANTDLAQCLRSRTPGCHSYLPRHNRRNSHHRPSDCR